MHGQSDTPAASYIRLMSETACAAAEFAVTRNYKNFFNIVIKLVFSFETMGVWRENE